MEESEIRLISRDLLEEKNLRFLIIDVIGLIF